MTKSIESEFSILAHFTAELETALFRKASLSLAMKYFKINPRKT